MNCSSLGGLVGLPGRASYHAPTVTDMIAKGELDVPEAEADQPIGRLGRGYTAR